MRRHKISTLLLSLLTISALLVSVTAAPTAGQQAMGNFTEVIQPQLSICPERPLVESDATVCQTSACIALSATVTSKLNASADPCEDFYNYACGNFPVNYKYDPDDVFKSLKRTDPAFYQNSYSVMRNELRNNLFEVLMLEVVNSTNRDVRDLYNLTRMLFRSCNKWTRYRSMKSDTVAGKRFFSSLLSHLLEGVSPTRSNRTIESILARIVNTDVHTMFDVRVPTAYIRELKRGNTNKLKQASRVVISANTKQYKSISKFQPYLAFFETVDSKDQLTVANESSTFARIIKEIQASERYANWSEGCNKLAKKKQHKISDLDALSRCANPRDPFSWSLFFDELLQTDYDPEALVELQSPTRVINFVSYFKKKATYAAGQKLSSHESLLVVDWLLSFASFLPIRLERLWTDDPIRDDVIERVVGGSVDTCFKWTKDLLSPVVERMYQKAYHADNFDHVQSLIDLLENATLKNVKKQEWIENGTKQLIVRKLLSLKHVIGFDVLSAEQLSAYYAPAISSFRSGRYSKVSEDKNFGRLFSIALWASARKKFNVLSENNSAATAFLTLSGLTTNAYNYMRRNEIVFPMGILSPPMYHRDYPDYMNLGGLGLVVGHEMGHAFDIKGRRISEEGIRGDFWDDRTTKEYLRRAECVRTRYSTYDLIPGVRHGSNTTLGNDIADILGLSAAYGAMRLLGELGRQRKLPNLPRDLTPERLFFVQAAQAWCVKAEPDALKRRFTNIKHSPPHLRVRGMMENSAEFAQVFQCRARQPMNPRGKCEFW